MSLIGILLGLIDIAITVLILVLIGAIVLWIFSSILSITIPQNIQRIYLAIVALIALVLVISLLMGSPRIHILAFAPTAAALNS